MSKQIRLRRINFTLCLVRRKNYVTQTLFDQQREDLIVRRSFGQPNRFGFATETKAKISESPENLSQTIALVAERKNCMTVSLRDCVSMTTATSSAQLIGD